MKATHLTSPINAAGSTSDDYISARNNDMALEALLALKWSRPPGTFQKKDSETDYSGTTPLEYKNANSVTGRAFFANSYSPRSNTMEKEGTKTPFKTVCVPLCSNITKLPTADKCVEPFHCATNLSLTTTTLPSKVLHENERNSITFNQNVLVSHRKEYNNRPTTIIVQQKQTTLNGVIGVTPQSSPRVKREYNLTPSSKISLNSAMTFESTIKPLEMWKRSRPNENNDSSPSNGSSLPDQLASSRIKVQNVRAEISNDQVSWLYGQRNYRPRGQELKEHVPAVTPTEKSNHSNKKRKKMHDGGTINVAGKGGVIQPLKEQFIPQQHDPQYSRRDKSLGLLCRNFLTQYNNDPNQYPTVSIDVTAKLLQVERRRIYDIINILESLSIVKRVCKNTYIYYGMGKEVMTGVMTQLQKDAITTWPLLARRFGILLDESGGALNVSHASPEANRVPVNQPSKEKSLGRLSQKFVQLFLLGMETVSLVDASRLILDNEPDILTVGTCQMNPLVMKPDKTGIAIVSPTSQTESKLTNKKNTRRNKNSTPTKKNAFKTKIRRLYDIANVMCSMGIIRKMTTLPDEGSNTSCNNGTNKSNLIGTNNGYQYPSYRWDFDSTCSRSFLRDKLRLGGADRCCNT